MSEGSKSNLSIRVTPEIVLRLVGCVIAAFVVAWIGGLIVGLNTMKFIAEYSFPYYAGVAVLGLLVLNPAIRKQRRGSDDSPKRE